MEPGGSAYCGRPINDLASRSAHASADGNAGRPVHALCNLAQDTLDTLSDTFLKIVLIFVLIINLVTSHKRLHSLLNLMLICAAGLAVGAIRDFLAGRYARGRIQGVVGGMFSNPNDLAAALALLVPLAVALALSNKGLARLAMGCACCSALLC
jgi:hypothetical protein